MSVEERFGEGVSGVRELFRRWGWRHGAASQPGWGRFEALRRAYRMVRDLRDAELLLRVRRLRRELGISGGSDAAGGS